MNRTASAALAEVDRDDVELAELEANRRVGDGREDLAGKRKRRRPGPGAELPARGRLRRAHLLLRAGSQQRRVGVEEKEPAGACPAAQFMIAAAQQPRCDRQQAGRGQKEVVAPVGPFVGNRAALHVLAPVRGANGQVRFVFVVEVAGIVETHGHVAAIARDTGRHDHAPRRAAIVIVADMDDQIGPVPHLFVGHRAEGPDPGEAVAGAGLRLLLGVAAAAAVTHEHDPARRAD